MKKSLFLALFGLPLSFLMISQGILIAEGGPSKVAKKFLAAMGKGDFESAKLYVSEDTKDGLDYLAEYGKPKKRKFKVLREEVDGEYARIIYTESGKVEEKVLKMKRDESGDWIVLFSKEDFTGPDNYSGTQSPGLDDNVVHGEKGTPSDVAGRFLKALKYGDQKEAERLASKETAPDIRYIIGDIKIGEYRIVGEEVDGDKATVIYMDGGDEMEKTLLLRKCGKNKWEVIFSKAEYTDLESTSSAEEPADTTVHGGEGDPKDVAMAFLNAMKHHDLEVAQRLASKETAPSIEYVIGDFELGEFRFSRYDIDAEGENAKFYYKVEGKEKEEFLDLAYNEHEKWEVIFRKSEAKESESDMAAEREDDGIIHGGEGTPADVAKEFLNAMYYGDKEKALRLASRGTGNIVEVSIGAGGIQPATVTREVVDGSKATVWYLEEGESETKTLELMLNEHEKWEVIFAKALPEEETEGGSGDND